MFKPGDRVRITEDNAQGATVNAGDTGTVDRIERDAIYVKMDIWRLTHIEPTEWAFSERVLELIPSTFDHDMARTDKLRAIKALRRWNMCSLKDAKDIVESIAAGVNYGTDLEVRLDRALAEIDRAEIKEHKLNDAIDAQQRKIDTLLDLLTPDQLRAYIRGL